MIIIIGSKTDLKVIFSPDHTSELYADIMRISLISSEKNSKVIQLFGKSRKKNMYIRGVEFLTANLNNESMMLTEVENETEGAEANVKDEKNAKDKGGDKDKGGEKAEFSVPTPILLSLYSIASSKSVGEYSQAEKTIFIGCMKSNAAAAAKDAKKV